MLKRILLITLIVTVAGAVFFSLLSANVYYNSSLEFAKNQLRRYMREFDESEPFDESGAAKLSETLFDARVTYILLDGTVVADSDGTVTQLTDHSSREEVKLALSAGEGFSVRSSSSVNRDMIYYCVRFDTVLTGKDGAVYAGGLVRIAMPTDSMWSIFVDSLPTLVWFLILVVLFCLFFTWLSTSFILKPVEKLAREMARSGGNHVTTRYNELKPIVDLMNEMSDDVREKAKKLSADSELEMLILDSMEHGMVIFRSPEDIVLINRTAANLLGYEKNQPVRLFVEDAEIFEALSSDETASVSRKFGDRDYMLRFTKEEKARVLLMTDITESVEASRSKNEFIANVTHEMNTPLTSIKGYAELIASEQLDKEQTARAAKTVISQSDRLSNLIKSIINFSAIDNDELSSYEVDASALVKEAIAPFSPRIAEKNISLTLNVQENVVLFSRRERLLEILNNLISNAIRYNKQDGSLTVTLTGGETPELIVSDTGIGISEENLPHIFSRFYTVDKSHNGEGGGFGLGLAIVRKLCRRAGWKLSVESRLGEGTSFKIVFSPIK